MYLTDEELRKRVDTFFTATREGLDEFDPDTQIGPASIDLRLSSVYWVPSRRLRFRGAPKLDLTQVATREVNPSRGWLQRRLRSGETLVLKPGEFALCRTAETFTIPRDCAGALEGRSSYARMGLSVHSSGGFINPGWSGQMPLTLHNQGPFALKIPAGAPLCQLMLVKLEGKVDQDYADREDRKYQNDYGGPSVWWRDELIKRIVNATGQSALSATVLGRIDELLDKGNVSDDALERLETFIGRQRVGNLSNADDLLDLFAKREDLYFHSDRIGRWGTTLMAGVFVPVSVTQALGDVSGSDVAWWVATLLVVVSAGYLQLRARHRYLTTDALREVSPP